MGFASTGTAAAAIASASQLIAYHTERDSGFDQVPVIKGQLASHAETREILSLPINQRSDGLPSAMSSLEVYRFDVGGGRVIYMVVTESGQIANLSIRLDDLPEIPRLPPTERPEPKKMEAPEGISIPDIDPRPIGFPIPDKDIRWVNEGTPIPEQRDLDDYILTVDRKDIKPAYVSLDTKRKGSLTGTKTPIPPNANEIEKKSLERENQSAEILSENGYNVEQNPKIDSIKNPDYKINGEVFDNIAPTSPSVRNIYDRASEKVLSGQTSNVVINLEGSSALASDLEKQFLDWPMEGLDKVIIIDQNGKITNIN